MFYTVKDIANITKGHIIGNPENKGYLFSIDSRTIIDYKNTIFFCFKGNNTDGHKFIDQLIEAGTKIFIVEKEIKPKKNETYILVNSTLNALKEIAKYHRKQFKGITIGISGSYGKTIIKNWLADILSIKYKVFKSPRNYNSQIGVPLSILMLNNNIDIGIFECSFTNKGEMTILENILKPNYGVFTNCSYSFKPHFSSLEEKINEFISLFKNSEKIFINDKYLEVLNLIKKTYPKKELIFLSHSNKNANLFIKEIIYFKNQTEVSIIINNKEYKFKLSFIAEPYIENALLTLLVSLNFEIDYKKVKEALINLSPQPMRLELIKSINNNQIINDTYSSDFTTIIHAINFLEKIKHSNNIGIIMSNFEAHENEEQEYTKVINIINSLNPNFFIGIGEKFYQYKDKFNCNAYFFNEVDLVIKKIQQLNLHNTTILLKGSRKYKLENIIEELQEKRYQTTLKIDIKAIIHNLNFYRSLLPKDTKIIAMVKAFGYGSGSYEIAKILQNNNVSHLCVAHIDEAIELRNNGIYLPIIVMNHSLNDYKKIFEYNLEPVVFNFKTLYSLINSAKYYSINNVNIHIEIDTGIHRLGFLPEECNLLAKELNKTSIINIKSIFTHLAAADNPIYDDFTESQIKIFLQVVEMLRKKLKHSFFIHILNTAGIERFNKYAFDAVRLGIGLYGFGGNQFIDYLQNVFTLKTIITQIKWIKSNETVGYNREWKIMNDTKIGIIPIGYADGLNRNLSNGKYQVKVNGKKANIIGNICMDMTMIDLTDINAQEGDEVIIFDSQESIINMAKILNTIPYEIITSISHRVKRIYVYE